MTQQVVDRTLRDVSDERRHRAPDGAMAHALRHTYGMDLAMRGVPLSVIQQLMGHDDPRTTSIGPPVLGAGSARRERQASDDGAEGHRTASADLRAAFPEMTGLSVRNLRHMRSMAAAWPTAALVQRVVARLPWGHNIELLDKIDDPTTREWYAREAIQHGWSRAVLANQIMSQLHLRAASMSRSRRSSTTSRSSPKACGCGRARCASP